MGLLRGLWQRLTGRHVPADLPEEPIFWTLARVYLARAYYLAAELGLADRLEEGPQGLAELAEATNTHPGFLLRLLRALAAFDVVVEDQDGRFHLAPRGRALATHTSHSVRYWTMAVGQAAWWQGLALALEAMRQGRPGFELAHGQPFYAYLAEHPEYAQTFIRGMSAWSDWHAPQLVAAYDFSPFGTIADIGGGNGSLLMEILQRYPHIRGILVDQPQTIEHARLRLEARGLDRRCRLVPADIRDSVPEGADVYVLKHVLRDWDDPQALRILQACHRAMPAHGRLLVIDALVDPAHGKDRLVKLIDLEQMLIVPGALRTREEMEILLAQAGFRCVAIQRTSIADAAMVEAAKTATAA